MASGECGDAVSVCVKQGYASSGQDAEVVGVKTEVEEAAEVMEEREEVMEEIEEVVEDGEEVVEDGEEVVEDVEDVEDEDVALPMIDQHVVGGKHLLENVWSLWYLKLERQRLWEEQLVVVHDDVGTVEDFWSLFKHVQPPSQLGTGSDYFFFKGHIKPMWEDTSNCKGGRWLINIPRSQRTLDLDCMWLELLLCLVGECWEHQGRHVCGACVNVRTKGDKISLWTSNCKDAAVVSSIGRRLKERLAIPAHVTIGYQAHVDTIKEGTGACNRFTL